MVKDRSQGTIAVIDIPKMLAIIRCQPLDRLNSLGPPCSGAVMPLEPTIQWADAGLCGSEFQHRLFLGLEVPILCQVQGQKPNIRWWYR
jgi:hypothetical protein